MPNLPPIMPWVAQRCTHLSPKSKWTKQNMKEHVNPPACRRVWLESVVFVSVFGLYLFLCSVVTRFWFVWIVSTPPPPPCYGHLAFIWRIAYIQDLPSAALFDSKKFDGVPISSFREHLRTLWQRGKNIQRCVVFLMKASRVFDNQFHHRICNFGPLTSAALCSIWNQKW